MQSQFQDGSKANEPPEYQTLAEESTGEPPVGLDDLPSPAREELMEKRLKEFKKFISARQTGLREQVWCVAHMDLLDRDTYENDDFKAASTVIDERWKLPKYWVLRMNNEMLAVWAAAFRNQPHSMGRLGELVRQIHDTGLMAPESHWLNWAVNFPGLRLSESAIGSPQNDVELLERMRLFQAAVGKALAELVNSYGVDPVYFLGDRFRRTREETEAAFQALSKQV